MEDTSLTSYNVIRSISRSRRFCLYQASSIVGANEVFIKTPDPMRLKDSELAQQLLKEAQTHIQLSHPGIRAGFEAREDNGVPFFIGNTSTECHLPPI
jgi:hypothetical protein